MPKLGQHLKPRTATPPPKVRGARWIALTREKFALVDARDFERLDKFSWVYHWQGHAFRKAPKGAKPAQISMHREILGVTDPLIQVDHRFGNRLDNRRRKLRRCTQTQNMRNGIGRARRKSRFKGVFPSGRKTKPWQSSITVNSKTIPLGRFSSDVLAARAYDAAAVKHFREFARTNFGSNPIKASGEFFI